MIKEEIEKVFFVTSDFCNSVLTPQYLVNNQLREWLVLKTTEGYEITYHYSHANCIGKIGLRPIRYVRFNSKELMVEFILKFSELILPKKDILKYDNIIDIRTFTIDVDPNCNLLKEIPNG